VTFLLDKFKSSNIYSF